MHCVGLREHIATKKDTRKNAHNLFNLGFVEVISSPHKGIVRRSWQVLTTKPKQLTHMNI